VQIASRNKHQLAEASKAHPCVRALPTTATETLDDWMTEDVRVRAYRFSTLTLWR